MLVEQMNQTTLIDHLIFHTNPTSREIYLQCGDMARTFRATFLSVTGVVFSELSAYYKGLCPAASVLHHTVPTVHHKHTQ